MHSLKSRLLHIKPNTLLSGFVISLAALLLWKTGALIGHLFHPVESPAAPETNSRSSDALNETSHAALPLRLFDIRPSAPRPSHEPVALRPSRLNASLQGTLVGPQGAVAIIRYRNRVQVLQAGDALVPGIVVRRITGRSVTLDNRGRLETLSLAQSASNVLKPAASSRERLAAQAEWAHLRRQIRRQPLTLLQYVRVEMVDNGRHLRLYPAKRPALFSSLGLEPGDTVLAVNDEPVSRWMQNPQKAMGLLNGAALRLTIRRHGQTRTLTIDLD